MRVVYVALKLCMIAERREYQRCLFRRGNCSNKGHSKEETLLVSNPSKDVFFSRNRIMIKIPLSRAVLFVPARRLTGTVTTRKESVWGSSSGEDGLYV